MADLDMNWVSSPEFSPNNTFSPVQAQALLDLSAGAKWSLCNLEVAQEQGLNAIKNVPLF
jgi:hypothetical protein